MKSVELEYSDYLRKTFLFAGEIANYIEGIQNVRFGDELDTALDRRSGGIIDSKSGIVSNSICSWENDARCHRR
jgi:hypothetical protein